MEAYLERCFENMNKCCKWGIKRRIQYSSSFNGFTAPLWRSPAPILFLITSVWSVILFVGILLTYVFVINDKPDCSVRLKGLIIAQLVFVGLNCKSLSHSPLWLNFFKSSGWSLHVQCQNCCWYWMVTLPYHVCCQLHYKRCCFDCHPHPCN